jgi:hypothetical protein
LRIALQLRAKRLSDDKDIMGETFGNDHVAITTARKSKLNKGRLPNAKA